MSAPDDSETDRQVGRGTLPQERMSASTSGYIQMDLQKGKDNQFNQIDWKKGEVQNQYTRFDLQRIKYTRIDSEALLCRMVPQT